MNIFFLLLFVIIVLNLVIPSDNQRAHNLGLVFSFALIFIYGALRVNYGSDYQAYENIYFNINSGMYDNKNNWEIGFIFLNQIVPSYRVLIIVLTLFFCICQYILFKKYIPASYTILSFILLFLITYYLIGNLTGIRNSVSICMLILSLPFLIKRQFIPFIIFIFLGSLFHTSSLFMLPIYFYATPKKWTSKNVVFFIIILAGLAIFARTSLGFETLLSLTEGDTFERYQEYLDEESIDIQLSIFTVIAMIFAALFIFFTSYFIQKRENTPAQNVILKLSLLFWAVCFFPNIGLSSRFFFYFAPFLTVSISIILSKIDFQLRVILTIIVLLFFSARFYNWTQNQKFELYFREYHSIITQ